MRNGNAIEERSGETGSVQSKVHLSTMRARRKPLKQDGELSQSRGRGKNKGKQSDRCQIGKDSEAKGKESAERVQNGLEGKGGSKG